MNETESCPWGRRRQAYFMCARVLQSRCPREGEANIKTTLTNTGRVLVKVGRVWIRFHGALTGYVTCPVLFCSPLLTMVPPVSTQPIKYAITAGLMTHTSCYSNAGLPPREHVMHVKWFSDARSLSFCLTLAHKFTHTHTQCCAHTEDKVT